MWVNFHMNHLNKMMKCFLISDFVRDVNAGVIISVGRCVGGGIVSGLGSDVDWRIISGIISWRRSWLQGKKSTSKDIKGGSDTRTYDSLG